MKEIIDLINDLDRSRKREENSRRLRQAFRSQDLAMVGLGKAVEALSLRIKQHEQEAERLAPLRAYGLEDGQQE